jgi:cell division transport system ATP-binding protein
VERRSAPGTPIIEFYHVDKAYQRDSAALSDVSLTIDKGDFVFVTGPSGAGKTTLLRLIFRAEEVTRGQLLVAGRNVGRIRQSAIPYLRRNIGVVFQDFKLLSNRTVAENVAFTLRVIGVPSREVQRRVWHSLKQVGLAAKAEKNPLALSGGEQQRVAIARALVNDPAILLADEPTGNLDHEKTLEIMELLMETNARGTTVIVATHDQGLIRRYARRVVALDAGRIVSDGLWEVDPHLSQTVPSSP